MIPYTASILALVAYMLHFWWPAAPAVNILWPTAGFFAIFSIYGGIIARAHADTEHKKAVLMATTIVGCLVLLGLSLSAIFLLAPTAG